MRKIFLLTVTIFIAVATIAQDQSNKGKEFWFAYPAHNAGTGSRLAIYLTSDVSTTGTVQFNGNSIPFAITANQTTIVRISNSTTPSNASCYIATNNVVEINKGIHITAIKPVVAYAHILNAAVSGSTLLLPKSVLGRDYVVSSYVPQGTTGGGVEKCEFVVVGVENATKVEITPVNADVSGAHPAGVPFQITLNQGDVYQFQSNLELSGSKVSSIASGSGGCKKIVVIGATTRSAIGCGGASSGDNLFQQLTPIPSWGKSYITVPFVLRNHDIIRVYVSNPVIPVIVNGTALPLASLISNSYYEFNANTPQEISSAEGIAVYQYLITQNCDGVQSDPEMILINSTEQTLKDITFVSAERSLTPPNTNITSHYVNIILNNTGTALASLKIDGAAPGVVFTPIGATSYVYARKNLTATTTAGSPSHRIICDSGFIAIAYGYGNVESYGYNAGTNVRDLYQQILVQTEYGIETTPAVCTGAPFKFKVSLPYCIDSVAWDFSLLPGPPVPSFDTIRYTTCAVMPYPGGGCDSTTVVNGKTLYWYSYPTIFTFGTIGLFDVNMTTFSSTSGNPCGAENDILFQLSISDPPIADFSFTTVGCFVDTVQFTETTPQLPKATYKFWWNFGDPASGVNNDTSNVRNPKHKFSGPGTYTVRFSDITTPGCLSDTISHVVTIATLPTATIGTSAALCLNAPPPPVTFTANGGTPPYTFTYNINGGPTLNITTVAGNSITINAPTNVAGVFNYNLLSVQNPAACFQVQTGLAVITVNPLPTATISGTTAVCLNAPSPNVTFTGAAGTAPYTFTYTINGGPNLTVTTVAGNSVTVPAPTNVVGVFTYTLVSVVDGSSTLCTQPQNGTTVITVNPLPTATISGTTAVCLNAPSPDVTFTGASGTAPYIFTYTINGGPNLTVTTVAGNSVTVPAPTNVAGVFTYALVSVQDGSSTLCTQPQSGTTVITVNPLPTAAISGTTAVCLNAPSPGVTFTGAAGTAPYTFTYTINGGPNLFATTVAGNSITVPAPTNVAGVFVYALVSVQDGSSTLCIQAQSGSATITVSVLPTATISGTIAVCLNSPSPNITFTGAAGTAPYTFTYTINGGPNLTVTTVAGNSVTVPAPTNVAGTFTYSLVSVQEGSGNACNQAQSGLAIVTVNPLPTATISGTTAVCLNAPSPVITFTGAGSTIPYTFTYTINGGPNLTVSTVAGNSVTVPVPTNVAGVFTYALVSVQDGSATLCSQAQVGTAIVTVHPLPTPNFTFTAPSCETRTISFTDASVANVGVLTAWAWNFGDPGSGAANTSLLQNPVHTFAASGVYNVTLSVTTSNGCVSLPVANIPVTINARPLAGFIIPEVCLSDTYAQFLDTSKVALPSNIVAWAWNFGDPFATVPNPNTSILQNPLHSYTAVGNYNVQLIVTTNTGCKDTILQVLTVNGSFPNSIFTVNNPGTLCANDSVAVVNLSTVFPGVITQVEITWDLVNFPAAVQLDPNPVFGKVYKHLYPNFQAPLTKPFTIRFRAYSGGVCLDDSIKVITVNAAPRVQFLPIPNTCLNVAPFQITQATETGGVPGTFVFSGPGVSATGIFNPLSVGPGTYTILYTYTSAAGGCVDTASQQITVLVAPVADFSFSAPDCETKAVTFTDASTNTVGALTTWTWDFGDGTPLVIRNNNAPFTHIFAVAGTYNVKLFVTTSNGCNSTVKQLPVVVKPQPKPNFTFPSSVCLPNVTVPFTNTSTIADGTQASFTYLWDFGDPGSGANNTSTAMNPTHVYTGVGPFSVNLQVTSGAGCIHDTTIVMNGIHPQPISAFSASKTSVCENETINFTDLSNGLDGTVTQWFWDFGDASPISNIQNPSHAYAPFNNYTVSLYIINSNGCNSDTSRQVMNVLEPPVANFSFSAPYCETKDITFTDASNAPVGNLTTWTWNFNDGSPLVIRNNNAPFTHAFPAALTYNVELTVTTNNGCNSALKSIPVNVHPLPNPVFSFDNTFYCIPNATVTFNNNSTIADGTENAFTYLWNFGDPASGLNNASVAKSPSHFYQAVGPYNVNLQVTSGNGCVFDKTIILNSIHPQPKADFRTAKPSVCIADNATFIDISNGMDGTVNQWNWDFGDGTNGITNPANHLYLTADTFSVSLYITNSIGCNSDTLTKPYAVYAYPTIAPMPDRFILEGGTIILEPVVSGQNLSFLWTPNLYMANNTMERPTVTKPLDDITYKLTVTGIGGCALSRTIFVKLLRFPKIPNTFTPNNDGINDTWRIDYLNTYPNNRVQVFTRAGQMIFESHGYNKPWDGTYKGKPMPLDTYYYIIEPGNGRDPITGYVTIIK